MQRFQYYTPTEVIFGKDTEQDTGAMVRKHGGSRVLIVYGGGSVQKSGLLAAIEKNLEQAGVGYELYGGAKPNPALAHAEAGVKKAIRSGVDMILAVGGGSAIDTAKGIAHGAANQEAALWDLWTGAVPLKKSLPVGVVLTIPAAGSEMSKSAVLTNEVIGRKQGLSTELNRPVFAIMNPELTYTLPRFQLGCGIVDIMMHTMDRYFTRTEGNELTDEFAEALLRTTIRNGRKALKKQDDYEAMSELMWCGSISHNGLTGLGADIDFAPHKLGHELSARYNVAHGASLSAVWSAWAEYCCSEKPERFQQFLKNVWGVEEADAGKAAALAIEKTRAFFTSIDMPVNFKDLGISNVTEADLQDMAERATRQDTITIGTFRPLNSADIYHIYKKASE